MLRSNPGALASAVREYFVLSAELSNHVSVSSLAKKYGVNRKQLGFQVTEAARHLRFGCLPHSFAVTLRSGGNNYLSSTSLKALGLLLRTLDVLHLQSSSLQLPLFMQRLKIADLKDAGQDASSVAAPDRKTVKSTLKVLGLKYRTPRRGEVIRSDKSKLEFTGDHFNKVQQLLQQFDFQPDEMCAFFVSFAGNMHIDCFSIIQIQYGRGWLFGD